MKSTLVVGGLMLLAPQAGGQVQVTPDSAARAEYHALLMGLRNAVDRVSARVNEFRRDLRSVGAATVLGRAGRLDATCRETRQALAQAQPRLSAARLAPSQVGARDTLVTAIGTLTAVLQRECERGLGPDGPGSRADTLRAWGPHRTSLVSEAASAYHGAAARLARRLGVDLSRP